MIIISDIHGNFYTMLKLLDKIPQTERDKGIVFAGDLIDRGPNSKQVVQWCIDNEIPVVKGNHEEMMLDETDENGISIEKLNNVWKLNGGFETLKSYNMTPIKNDGSDSKDLNLDYETIKKHRKWMKNLPYYLEFKDVKNEKGEYLLVTHSSASKVWKWNDKRRKEQYKHFIGNLIWSRPNNISPIPGIFNVFGHTPIVNGPRIKECYANIDTGCAYHNMVGYGKLTALQFPDMIVYQQENVDKE